MDNSVGSHRNSSHRNNWNGGFTATVGDILAEKSKKIEKEDIIEKFSEFLTEVYYNEMTTALSEGKKSLTVDFSTFDRFDPELADYILENPNETLPMLDEAVERIDIPGEIKLHIRLVNLPESRNIRIRNLRSEHIGKLIAVDGIVKRASDIRPEVSEAIFQCPDCGLQISVIQEERRIIPPTECECGCRKKFRMVGHKLYDVRWVTIEEPFEITSGEQPSDITIFLKEDLTSPRMQNKTDPGNRIKIVGILKEMPRRVKGSSSRQMEIYIDANSIESVEVEWEELELTGEDEQKIIELANDPMVYQKLVESLAPTIYGMEEVKEAIVLQMFGGQPKALKDGTRIRGELHLLLVGDPSCLVADERVLMSDGTILKIGKMGSEHLQNLDYNVHVGMGRKTGKANRFHIYNKQPIIEIITETGKSIKGTYNQPVLIKKNMQQSWKRLDEVKIGDDVRVLPKIDCRKKSLVPTGWKDFSYYHKSWHIKVPEFVDDDLASLFGYIIADGWVTKNRVGLIVNNDEHDIIPKLKKMFEKCFDSSLSSYKHKRASPKVTYYQLDRGHAAKLLAFLNEKRVPDFIFQSGDSVVASFLRWLYEGDGTVFSKGRGCLSVSLKSGNIELLRDVQLLLLRFGIHSRILWEARPKTVKIKERRINSNPSGSLMIRRSESIIKFWQYVGFASEKKKSKLEIAVQYAKSHIHRIHKELTERIVQITRLPPQDVFDIEVPKYHRFVANGIIVHNTAKSQLMKLASTMIPRGKYVSGRGVTYAGLTATVVKDEEFLGGWVLEAGAIVLANRSLCAIDEFTKVDVEDRVALQESMSLGTVSVAKASIVASLPAQTAILAGGNPKLGRFDPYVPIREQIDIDDVLLSRFDLRFALRDIPNPEHDAKMVEHILKTRHFDEESGKPSIDRELFRKFIAYAKKNCRPQLTQEASEEIKKFYLELREKSLEGPVSITFRQYESLVRLAEASAKVQLRNEITVEDALRALNLMKTSLRQFGFEPETGKIDIDRAEGYMSAAQRSKIRVLLDIIDALSVQYGKDVPEEEVVKRATAEGVTNADDMLRKMIEEGVLFNPRRGFVQKVMG